MEILVRDSKYVSVWIPYEHVTWYCVWIMPHFLLKLFIRNIINIIVLLTCYLHNVHILLINTLMDG